MKKIILIFLIMIFSFAICQDAIPLDKFGTNEITWSEISENIGVFKLIVNGFKTQGVKYFISSPSGLIILLLLMIGILVAGSKIIIFVTGIIIKLIPGKKDDDIATRFIINPLQKFQSILYKIYEFASLNFRKK